MQSKPFVSVLMATYRRENRLRGCLQALSKQVGEFSMEVCLVNDGGPPIRSFAADFPDLELRIRDLPSNVGQVAARNFALEMAEGDYLALCDDDDRWLAGHVQSLLNCIDTATDVPQIAYTDAELVWLRHNQSTVAVSRRAPFAWHNASSMLREYNPVVPSSLLYNRRVHDIIGPFDVAMSHYWDWDFLLSSSGIANLLRVHECQTLYGIDTKGVNLSSNPEAMRSALLKLINKHHLGDLPSSNFERMLTDANLASKAAKTTLIWDGNTDIW